MKRRDGKEGTKEGRNEGAPEWIDGARKEGGAENTFVYRRRARRLRARVRVRVRVRCVVRSFCLSSVRSSVLSRWLLRRILPQWERIAALGMNGSLSQNYPFSSPSSNPTRQDSNLAGTENSLDEIWMRPHCTANPNPPLSLSSRRRGGTASTS